MLSASLVRRNSWFILIGQVVRMASTALVFVIVARVYGPVEFGSYTAAHTLTTIFLIVADFGFDILLTWEVGRRQEQAGVIISRYLGAKLMVALFATMAMAIIGILLDVSALTRTLMLVLSASVFFSALVNFFVALFRGIERFQYESWLSLGSNTLLLIGTGAAAILGAPLWVVASLFVASRLLAASAAAFLGARSVGVRRLEWAIPSGTELRRIGIFGVQAIFAALFFTQDTLLLALWKGDAQVGVYQAAFKLIGLLFLLPDVLMTALFPSLARSHDEDHLLWKRVGILLQKTLVALGVSLSLVLVVVPDLIIRMVYGAGTYDDSIVILRIFSASVFVHCATISFAVMLTTSGRHATRMLIVVSATIFNFILNAVMIPIYGPVGAAIVSVGTLVGVGLGYVLPVRSLFIEWIREPRVYLTLILGVVLAGVTVLLKPTAGWAVFPIGLVLCGTVMWHAFAPSERRAVFGRELARLVPRIPPRP